MPPGVALEETPAGKVQTAPTSLNPFAHTAGHSDIML